MYSAMRHIAIWNANMSRTTSFSVTFFLNRCNSFIARCVVPYTFLYGIRRFPFLSGIPNDCFFSFPRAFKNTSSMYGMNMNTAIFSKFPRIAMLAMSAPMAYVSISPGNTRAG